MCRSVVETFFPPAGLDYDDLMQLARIGAWKALTTYDAERVGPYSNVGGWVAFCARKEVQTGLTQAHRQKHCPLNESERFERPLQSADRPGETLAEVVPSSLPSPHARAEQAQELRELARAFRERLSDLECASIVGLLNGQTYEEIADRYGVSTKMVDNATWRGRKKLNADAAPVSGGRRQVRYGYKCPECGGATIKKVGRGRPPRCVVCRTRTPRRQHLAVAA